MAEINKIRRCYNCGAELQCDDPNKKGYVKKETLDNATQNFLFCDKCFEMERFKDTTNEPEVEPEFLAMLKDAKKNNALIVYLVNLFSFEAAFSHQINEIINGMNILVVGNKYDLLPKDVNPDDMKEYVAHRFRAAGLDINGKNVVLANAFNDETAREVMLNIYELKNGKSVYIIGSHLSGKSTLVSSILRVFNNLSRGTIVTEPYPNTSISVLKIPLNASSAIYDTPGFSFSNSVLHNVDKTTFNSIYNIKPVKERVATLAKTQCLFIGGLAFVELLNGQKTTFSCYFNEKIILRRTHLSRIEPDEQFVRKIHSKALKPSLATITSVRDLDTYEITVTESGQRDIGILGLGWFSFKAKGQVLKIYVPKGVSIYHSRSKITK